MRRHSNTAKESFQRRIEPLLDRAAAYAYVIVHHRQDAEDVLQEATLKGLLAFESYDPSRPFKAWWFAIIRNCCRDLLRGKRARGASIAIEQSDATISRTSHVDQQDEMRFAFEKLSDARREILELRYFGDCSYREIAAILSIPEGTVMSRLYAARQALVAIYKRRAE
jgi:RNA polymerase sigma-70 factor (ECF subfamily)